jgi:hypothetical protein
VFVLIPAYDDLHKDKTDRNRSKKCVNVCCHTIENLLELYFRRVIPIKNISGVTRCDFVVRHQGKKLLHYSPGVTRTRPTVAFFATQSGNRVSGLPAVGIKPSNNWHFWCVNDYICAGLCRKN